MGGASRPEPFARQGKESSHVYNLVDILLQSLPQSVYTCVYIYVCARSTQFPSERGEEAGRIARETLIAVFLIESDSSSLSLCCLNSHEHEVCNIHVFLI